MANVTKGSGETMRGMATEFKPGLMVHVTRGGFLNGLYHGQGTLTYRSGDQYFGQWVNGVESGEGHFKRKS